MRQSANRTDEAVFETRYHKQREQWYVVSSVDGHLAHIRKDDGQLYAAFFDEEEAAAEFTNQLNLEVQRSGGYELQ